jgi:methionyl-tRNA formyltransferase
MLYLFCNEGYGLQFLEVATKFASMRKVSLTAVFSGKSYGFTKYRSFSFFEVIVFFKKKMTEIKLRKSYQTHIVIVRDINSFSFVNRIEPSDHGVIAGFNQIFRQGTISRFSSLVNFHPSLLPCYRGPVPSYWCIQNGEITTGYTLHTVTPKIDSGEILFQEAIPIDNISDSDHLDKIVALKASRKLNEYLSHLYLGKDWHRTILEPKNIYKTCVDYASFPQSI